MRTGRMLSPNPESLAKLVELELQGIVFLLVFTLVAGFVLRRTFKTVFGDEFIEQNPSK